MKIIPNRRYWFLFSGVLVLLSVLFISIFEFNFGLDFTGGSRWEIAFENKDTSLPAVREFLDHSKLFSQVPKVQTTTDGHYLITLEKLSDEQLKTVKDAVQEKFGTFTDVGYRTVDSAIGGHFKLKAMYAVLASLVVIIFYVAFAFRLVPKAISPWRFGAVSIFALIHDVVILLGIFAVLGKVLGTEVDLSFLTAVLATFGYSMNDTIVILDRVRENIRFQKPNETFADIVERSLWETMRRSFGTAFATLIPLITLLIFGAESIFYFVLALFVGIILGTYSSIFIAAPLLVSWKAFADKRS